MANENVLAPLVKGWLNKINLSLEFKKKEFQKDADECLKFVKGPYGEWLYQKRGKDENTALDYDGDDADIKAPTFRMTVNKAAELRDLFGPAMYPQNPDRKVLPRRAFMPKLAYWGPPEDPNTQQVYLMVNQQVQQSRANDGAVAELFEALLNATPTDLGLHEESRLVVNEALIQGMGVWWTECVVHPSGQKVVGNFYDPVRNLVLDMDAKRWEDGMYCARWCCHPTWQVEDEYGYKRGSLKGNLESQAHLSETQNADIENYRRTQGRTNDLLCYWKVWSKMGLGARLENVLDQNPEIAPVFETLGNYCYLVVAAGYDYPLNIPPWVIDGEPEAFQKACEWPIPFWLDAKSPWPFTAVAFHRDGEHLWPTSHLAPAIGELKFINWVWSFLLGKIRVASRDILVLVKGLSDDIKNAIVHGPDYSVVEISQLDKSIDELVKFIQHPPFHPEIEKLLDRVMEMFDKRTGLTELVYGSTESSLRSAQEAEVKQANASVRPGDMAKQVEDAGTTLARKEMAASRWLLEPPDIEPILGPVGAFIWQKEVLTIPPEKLFHVFECRVEAGSGERPNKERDRKSVDDAMHNVFPPLFQFAISSGQFAPANAVLGDWAIAHGKEPEKYLLSPPPMPVAPAPTPGGGGPQQGQQAGPPR